MFNPDMVHRDQIFLFQIGFRKVAAPALLTTAVDFAPCGAYECLSQIQITFCLVFTCSRRGCGQTFSVHAPCLYEALAQCKRHQSPSLCR